MAMSDDDWGSDKWDVDVKAESLNKALFGKRRKKTGVKLIKPDCSNSGEDFGQGSGDDDDDNEQLSKKAKKKLKERRRKENVRNKKKKNASEEQNQEDEASGGEKENQKTKLSKSSSKVLDDKKKGKTKDVKSDQQTKGNKAMKIEKKKSLEKNKENETMKNKKRKNSLVSGSNDNDGGDIPAKLKKTENGIENSDSLEDNESKKKKTRKKKKKPSSKKNKYKHLGLKSDRPVASDSDNESGQVSKTDASNPPQKLVSVDNKTVALLEKSTKRKRSLSPEKMPVKKAKLLQESEKSSLVKSKKEKKCSDTPQNSVRDKNSDRSDVPERLAKKLKKKNNEIIKSEGTIGEKISENMESENKPKKLKKDNKKMSKDASNVNTKLEVEEKETSSISPFFSSQGMNLQQKCMDKLISGRFRFINEQLYTIKGDEAFRMFQHDKTLMDTYNTGFQSQVKQWSVNPLDVIIKQLSSKPSRLKVADFGCGEARLSASVPQKVHSLDLYALNERVTVCNMAKTPLGAESVDIAVFCLSLMGTNLNDYLLEANRVLKEGGILKVAEVVSRFTNVNQFISAVSSMGFQSLNSRDLSKMFYLMDFKKVRSMKKSSKQIKELSLNPCVYKKR